MSTTKIKVIKESNSNFEYKSFQMRIEFGESFSDSDYEKQLIKDFDEEWKKIGVFYFWHIGEDFADGFFEDFNEVKITLDEIIASTRKNLDSYKDKIKTITFKDIN